MIRLGLLTALLTTLLFAGVVDQTEIQKVVDSLIQQQLSGQYEKVETILMKRPAIDFPADKFSILVTLPKKLMGMISVPVVLKEGTIMTRLNYSVHVKVFKTVPVLVKSKSRYGEISHSDTQSELKDVTALLLSGKKIKESFQRGELRSQRYLNAGTILTNRNTELMPDVPKSTLISLMVKYDALALKMDVTTLEDGFVGDTVKVMSPKYKKVLLAKLINDTEAEYIN